MPTSRTATPTSPRGGQPSGSRARPASSAARSRTRPASREARSTTSTTRSSGSRPGSRRRARCRCLHCSRPRRELHPRPARPRRHDQAAAGLREGRRRRALRAGPARARDHPNGRLRGRQAGQRGDECRRTALSVARWRRSASSGSAWAALCRAALGAFIKRRARDEGEGRLHLDERHRVEPGPEGRLEERDMTLTVKQLAAGFAASLGGVDITRPAGRSRPGPRSAPRSTSTPCSSSAAQRARRRDPDRLQHAASARWRSRAA